MNISNSRVGTKYKREDKIPIDIWQFRFIPNAVLPFIGASIKYTYSNICHLKCYNFFRSRALAPVAQFGSVNPYH